MERQVCQFQFVSMEGVTPSWCDKLGVNLAIVLASIQALRRNRFRQALQYELRDGYPRRKFQRNCSSVCHFKHNHTVETWSDLRGCGDNKTLSAKARLAFNKRHNVRRQRDKLQGSPEDQITGVNHEDTIRRNEDELPANGS